MKSRIRSIQVLALVGGLACAASFAQSTGEAVYKQKCLNCHGVAGLANSGVGKVMKVKPANDPDVKKMSEAAMLDSVRKGEGKMQAYKDRLTAAEIKASVEYFRTFVK